MSYDDVITPQVIESARRGDAEAITMIYETYLKPMYRYIAYRVGSDFDVEDLTMEVFVQMMHYLPKYEYKGIPFEAWLYRLAATQVAGFYRERGRKPQQVQLTDNLHEIVATPEKQIIDEQQRSKLREAINQLGEEEQDVLILRFVEGKTHQQVAMIIDKSETAVKSIQHRALIRLTRLLGSDEKVKHYLRGDDRD